MQNLKNFLPDVWPLYWLKIQNGGYHFINLFISSLFLEIDGFLYAFFFFNVLWVKDHKFDINLWSAESITR